MRVTPARSAPRIAIHAPAEIASPDDAALVTDNVDAVATSLAETEASGKWRGSGFVLTVGSNEGVAANRLDELGPMAGGEATDESSNNAMAYRTRTVLSVLSRASPSALELEHRAAAETGFPQCES